MALNFSHRPVFPPHLSEDNLVAPNRIANGYRVDGISESNGDGFGKPWFLNRDVESQESVAKDILDLLPSDPFGMDISTTFTAITSWLEDLEVDYDGYKRDQVGTSDENYQLFAGLNFIWNNAMMFQTLPSNLVIDNTKSNVLGGFGGYSGKGGSVLSSPSGFRSAFHVELDDILGTCNEGIGTAFKSSEAYQDNVFCSGGDNVDPHPALSFALGYLGVHDLLNVEMVCKSLRSTVQGDSLLWRTIHIDQPLNEKITDDMLLQLTSRAQGNLQCLSLVECPRITDDAIKRILESNPKLTKLSVSGCTRLSIEGIVTTLKDFKSMGREGVKHLRIGGLYGVTQKHFEELKFLLGTDNQMPQDAYRPHFYYRGSLYLPCDDDRAIDIEVCPRCKNLRLVYDCPAEGCQGKEHGSQACRACTLCIARCIQCGQCINDNEYEETFCLELLCSVCWKQQVKYQERQDTKVGITESRVLHGESYSFNFHG